MEDLQYTDSQKSVMSLDFILLYLRRVHPQIHVKSVTPYSFTIGSNNDNEGLKDTIQMDKSLFFGTLQICINPNSSPLADEKIEIKYKSYFNTKPYFKRITRQVEKENYINEATFSTELFDTLTITQASVKYDFYLTFIGFKIDYN